MPGVKLYIFHVQVIGINISSVFHYKSLLLGQNPRVGFRHFGQSVIQKNLRRWETTQLFPQFFSLFAFSAISAWRVETS
jgi:hypothetical protein